jgi:hypothetical protein
MWERRGLALGVVLNVGRMDEVAVVVGVVAVEGEGGERPRETGRGRRKIKRVGGIITGREGTIEKWQEAEYDGKPAQSLSTAHSLDIKART